MEGSNGSRKGFDASARAAERESGPVVLGDSTYHPARLTNKKLREVRRLSREAQAEAKRLARESQEYKDAYDEEIGAGKSEAEAAKLAEEAATGAEAVSEVNMRSLAQQLPFLLVDDNAQPITEEAAARHLDDDVDARDIDGLMTYLLGSSDPTPEAETTSTSS